MKIYEDALPKSARAILGLLNKEIRSQKFYLAGGSGLALQIGHRISEDLDFFTPVHFKTDILINYLNSKFIYEEILVSKDTLYCNLNGVKASFIYYGIPLVYPTFNFKGVEVASWQDILAEKFKTLSQRGSRKDFYDIYFTILLQNISIGDAIRIFKKRFKGTGVNNYHILKSLVYFEDAEEDPDLSLLKEVSWEEVKSFFIKNLREFEKYLLNDC